MSAGQNQSKISAHFIKKWQEDFSGPTIVCSHNPADIFELAEELWVIEAGKLHVAGPVTTVMDKPTCEYTDAFFHHFNPK